MPRATKYDENDELISGYRLVSFLGAGQFGEVWKALEETTRKLVAIKIIDLSHSDSALKELKALNLVINLNHPNLIPIFTARLKDKNGREIPLHKTEEYKQKGGLRELVIAMGLGDKSLSSRLKELNPDGTDPADFKGLPVDELLGYMQGAARGIDFLNKADHGLGTTDGPIVHCDIKPDNMMIVSGEVQIADCGVAVIITPDIRKTKAAGSPAYSAPELTGNKPVPGTDQYALAISYYELRTGHLPFDEHMNQLSIMLAHAEGRLDFSSPLLTQEEVRVLKWATSVRTKDRYPTCLDMVKQLERAIEGLQPFEPSQIGVRSGVVQVPLRRPASNPVSKFDPAVLRSTPNLPKPAEEDSHSVDLFAQPPGQEELRGTVIPNSDHYLAQSESGLALPETPDGKYGASQSDIQIPVGNDPFADDDFADPDADSGLSPASPARPPENPAPSRGMPDRSMEISRPSISADRDDPMGAKAGTVELDPEIAKIIKGSAPVKQPGVRLPAPAPAAPAVQTQRPPSRAETKPVLEPNKRSTQLPRETPAEEEAKSLPPWAKEAKSLPPWEKELNTTTSTKWKEPDTAKASGGGAKLIVGGVLVAGLAAGGVYFSGLLGGGNGSSAVQKNGEDKKPPTEDSNKGQVTPKNEDPKIDTIAVAAIEKLIERKTPADFITAQNRIDELPKDPAHENERKRLASLLVEARSAYDKKLDEDIKEIDSLIATFNEKGVTEFEEKKSIEAERLISQLPRELPTRHIDKRAAWTKTIDNFKVMIAKGEADKKFAELLNDLATRPKTTFVAQAKIILGDYKKSEQQKKFGLKLISVGEEKSDYRDDIIKFLTEDPTRMDLLLPGESDRTRVFQWRVAPLTELAKKLRGKLESLTTGKVNNAVAQDIYGMLDDLKQKKSSVGTPFGTRWDDKYLDAEITNIYSLATIWSEANTGIGNGIQPLRDLVQKSTAPDIAFPMALEYQRIGIGGRKPETIENLRKARDVSAKWTGLTAPEKARIDALFQAGLAVAVHKELVRPVVSKPDWKKLVESTCGPDSALGWKTVAEAEWNLDQNKALPQAFPPADSKNDDDPTAADRKTLIEYLKAMGGGKTPDTDAILQLYTGKNPILDVTYRKKTAAAALVSASTVAMRIRKPEEILAGTGNPYAADTQALALLKKADELDGKDHPEWALRLYFLADAGGDRETARIAASRVSLDETKSEKPEDLALAMAFFRSRAVDSSTDRSAQVAAYARTARLAYRYFEASLDSKDSGAEREKAFFPKIVDFAQRGLDLSAGSNADRRSLEFCKFRNIFLTNDKFTSEWLKDHRPTIESIARDLDRGHPDYPDAKAFKAFVTLMRFSGLYGDLNEAKEPSIANRSRAWTQLLEDAEDAIRVDPTNGYAHRTLAMALYGTFKELLTPYAPPKPLIKNQFAEDRSVTLKTAEHFKLAGEALKFHVLPSFWRQRAVFLFAAANDFAKAGISTNVGQMLQDAAVSAKRSYDERPDHPMDDMAMLGRIQEDLAWLGNVRPPENYEAALKSLATAASRPAATDSQKIDNVRIRVDRARAVVRAVMFGHFPASRLSEVNDAVTDMNAEIEKIPEADRTRLNISFVEAQGIYWKAMARLVDKNYTAADRDLKAATDALKSNRIVGFYALGQVHRAEAILAGGGSRDDIPALVDELKASFAMDQSGQVERQLAFAPDYILARKALADGNPADAARSFRDAFRAIDDAKRKKTLLVEDGFALRCLAYEIVNVKLNAGDLGDRKRLLGELEKDFAWALTPDDKTRVADAKKKLP